MTWFSVHRFKLEVEGFIFHIPQKGFPNSGLKILAFSKKSSDFLFSLILFSAGTYLLKDWSKHSLNGNIFFLFLFKLIEKRYFSKTSILINKASLVLIFFLGLKFSKFSHLTPYRKTKQKQKAERKESFAELKNI